MCAMITCTLVHSTCSHVHAVRPTAVAHTVQVYFVLPCTLFLNRLRPDGTLKGRWHSTHRDEHLHHRCWPTLGTHNRQL